MTDAGHSGMYLSAAMVLFSHDGLSVVSRAKVSVSQNADAS